MARWFKMWDIPEEHWLNEDLRYIGGWYDLNGMAEWKDRKIVRGGSMIEAKRGTVYTSIHELADRWHVSRKWVRHFLEMLTEDGMITELQRDHRGYHLKVNNYAKYQDKPNHRGTTDGTTKETTEGTTEDTTEVTTKATSFLISEEGIEGIEGESRTQTKLPKRFVPPTREELVQYSSEKGLGLNVDRFLDYYESNGWRVGKNPMKDWRAAARTWAAKDNADARNKAAPNPKRFNNFEPRQGESAMDAYIRQLEEATG